MSKAKQQKAVGEGLAVGLLTLGVEATTSGKQAIEFAFRRAWADWSGNSHFPQVKATLARTDIMLIIGDSQGRMGVHYVDWVKDGSMYAFEPQQDWPVEELSDFLADGVSHERWVDLARAFLAELKENEYRKFELHEQ